MVSELTWCGYIITVHFDAMIQSGDHLVTVQGDLSDQLGNVIVEGI